MNLESGGAILVSVAAGVALAAAAGLRAFLPLLVVGVAARVGIVDLHESVAFLSSNVALGALLLGTLLELVADKIPLVDHGLDLVSTFVRPAAGFVAGLALLAELPEPVTVVLALFFAMISLGTHLGHAKTRVGSTLLTGGVGNPVLSFLEDAVSALLSVLAVLAPILALGILVGFSYLVVRLVRKVRDRRVMAAAGGGVR